MAAVLRRSITELCKNDHHDCKEILESWLKDKTPKFVDVWISSPDAYCVTALAESDEIIGFGMMNCAGEMRLLYVSPNYVGVGAGHDLLRAMEEQATTWGLAEISLDSTITAKRFYEHHGYLSGESCKSRSDGLNCHTMYKSLVPNQRE